MTRAGCEQTERVAEYALRMLPASDRPAFQAHVDGCPDCRRELEELQPVVDAFTDWPTDVLRPPAPLWERLADRVAAGAELAPEARWVDEPAWRDVAPGIACKVLATDDARGRVSMLVRLEPGVAYPAHTHAEFEELHLLDGELWIDERKLLAGDYYRAEIGTADARVWSETGCTCVLVTSFRDILR